MKSKWKDAPLLYKLVSVASVLASIAVIVLALLQIFGIWNRALNISLPLMGVIMFCQAYILWKANRKLAYFSIGAESSFYSVVLRYFSFRNSIIQTIAKCSEYLGIPHPQMPEVRL